MRLSEYWTYLKNIEEEKADQIEEIKRRSEAYRNDIKNSVSLDSHIKTKDNIILVEQFRIATRNNLLEIPAGKIENGETPDTAALREMNEEIGFSGKLTPLFQCYLAPGYDTEKMYFFLASELKLSKKRLPQDEDEEIRIRRMKLGSALEKCLSGQIIDCKTIAAIMMILKIKKSGVQHGHQKVIK